MFHAKLARTLPAGKYRLAATPGRAKDDEVLDQIAWALGGYSYDSYRKRPHETPVLACTPSKETLRIAQGVFLARDLINTPANDMGPDELEKAFRKLGKAHSARVKAIKGDALIKANFPMVHAVGRASATAEWFGEG